MKKPDEEPQDYFSNGFSITYYRSDTWQKQYSADNQPNDHYLLVG